ncbi:S1/P1 nuclease [soil metagenome]
MRLFAIGVILSLLAPSFVFGWGGDGHQIVCLIAEARLTPIAKAAIHDLLGDDVDISDAEIASWADQIRRERRATAPWHYVNIPVDAAAFDAKRDGKNGENIINKIVAFEKFLADTTAPKRDRTDALKFLVHFVGDLHQPLHCVDRNGDKGGNGRLVFFGERKKAVSLHQTWDSLILLRHKGKTRVLDYADALNTKITNEQAIEWIKGTPEDWANQSHRIAVSSVYRDVPADGPPPKLTDEYIEKSGEVIDEQLAMAGVRLAAMLNRCFPE